VKTKILIFPFDILLIRNCDMYLIFFHWLHVSLQAVKLSDCSFVWSFVVVVVVVVCELNFKAVTLCLWGIAARCKSSSRSLTIHRNGGCLCISYEITIQSVSVCIRCSSLAGFYIHI